MSNTLSGCFVFEASWLSTSCRFRFIFKCIIHIFKRGNFRVGENAYYYYFLLKLLLLTEVVDAGWSLQKQMVSLDIILRQSQWELLQTTETKLGVVLKSAPCLRMEEFEPL